MKSITVRPVTTKKDLKRFIRFNYELYKGNPYSVPDLYEDMVNTLSPNRNAAFEFCEMELFLAYKEDKLVGRVAAIINHRANETWNKKEVRFGWIDFIDDLEVSKSLLSAVEEWGRSKGMEEIQGPLGFTDFDAEGMLVEGFDQLSTMATIYNYPYYPKHLETLGYVKDVDWVEFKIKVPEKPADKPERLAVLVAKRYNLHTIKCTSHKTIAKEYGKAIFELMNEAYAPLYGYSALSEGQIEQYVKMYLPIIDLRLVSMVADADNKLVAVGISMPSLSLALQKAKGKMMPFGWYHMLKALYLKRPKVFDFLLIAVKPEYQNKGINSLIFKDLTASYIKLGYQFAETNPELETNNKVQAQWEYFDYVQHKRRRAFKKPLTKTE